MLNEVPESITEPLTIIFNKSMMESILPSEWKRSNITPLHKKGSCRVAGNYQPVSLTLVIGKVMESIVRDAIIKHMMDNNLFAEEQHGSTPGRSCITQLLWVLEEWTDMLDIGESVDVIYLDFKKAFDSVPHARLLKKLQAYGINGKHSSLIENKE